jgi:hypothetical protein
MALPVCSATAVMTRARLLSGTSDRRSTVTQQAERAHESNDVRDRTSLGAIRVRRTTRAGALLRGRPRWSRPRRSAPPRGARERPWEWSGLIEDDVQEHCDGAVEGLLVVSTAVAVPASEVLARGARPCSRMTDDSVPSRPRGPRRARRRRTRTDRALGRGRRSSACPDVGSSVSLDGPDRVTGGSGGAQDALDTPRPC